MRKLIVPVAALSILAALAVAGPPVVGPQATGGGGVDSSTVSSMITSAIATKADVSSVPTPASTVPPSETPGGAAGATMTFRRGDAVQPRITRAQVVTTDSSCNFSSTWTNPLASAPTISLAWVNAGSNGMKCELTSDPTTTSAAGRCKVDQPFTITLAALTAAALTGLTVLPAVTSAACVGIKVHVIALPPAL
jgi:hypothetical protein